MKEDDEMLDLIDSVSKVGIISSVYPSIRKCKAYKLKYDALKRQGKRTDLTFGTMSQKLNSIQQISKESDGSVKQIQRFIRLTNLIDPLIILNSPNKLLSIIFVASPFQRKFNKMKR